VFRHHLGALALVAAFAFPLAASAQTAPAPGVMPSPGAPPQTQTAPHHRHHRNRYMQAMRGLGLSDAQKQQISSIVKNARAANAANKTTDPQTRRANMQALRQQIEVVLTPDQRNQLHAKLSQERQQTKPSSPAQPPAQ
jgi:Spy/CpxP family protein refolding chaperone